MTISDTNDLSELAQLRKQINALTAKALMEEVAEYQAEFDRLEKERERLQRESQEDEANAQIAERLRLQQLAEHTAEIDANTAEINERRTRVNSIIGLPTTMVEPPSTPPSTIIATNPAATVATEAHVTTTHTTRSVSNKPAEKQSARDPRKWRGVQLVAAVIGLIIGLFVASFADHIVLKRIDGFEAILVCAIFWVGCIGFFTYVGAFIGAFYTYVGDRIDDFFAKRSNKDD